MSDAGSPSSRRDRHLIQSVIHAFELRDLIEAQPGLTAKQLGRRMQMRLATLRGYLKTLTETDLIVTDEEGQIFINPLRRLSEEDLRRFVRLVDFLGAAPGGLVKDELALRASFTETEVEGALAAGVQAGMVERDESDRYRLALLPRRKASADIDTILAEYADTTGREIALATLYDAKLVLTHLAGDDASLLASVTTDATHATAAGHALLHQLEPDQRDEYLKQAGMVQFTEHTPTTPGQLEKLLAPDHDGIYTALGQFCCEGACLAIVLRSGAPDGRCVALTAALPCADLEQERVRLSFDLFRAAVRLVPLVGPIPVNLIEAGIQRMEDTALSL